MGRVDANASVAASLLVLLTEATAPQSQSATPPRLFLPPSLRPFLPPTLPPWAPPTRSPGRGRAGPRTGGKRDDGGWPRCLRGREGGREGGNEGLVKMRVWHWHPLISPFLPFFLRHFPPQYLRLIGRRAKSGLSVIRMGSPSKKPHSPSLSRKGRERAVA